MSCFNPLAYIDPGSGSILLQVLLAGALGAAALCWRSLAHMGAWLLRPFRSKPAGSAATQPPEDAPRAAEPCDEPTQPARENRPR